MANVDDVIKVVRSGVASLAAKTLGGFISEAESDAESFLRSALVDVQKWMIQLAAGELDEDDFVDLLAGEKDLAQLQLLKARGVAQIKLDEFTNGLVELVTNSVLSVI
jgi:hypothetical protein